MVSRTHNAYHLGDNLVHLHWLRKVALANPERQFIHAAQWQYLNQLRDVVADVPNVELTDFNYATPESSIDSWRGSDGFWYSHEHRNDFVKFHTEYWFPYLAAHLHVDNPIRTAADMLFDYPNILQSLNGEIPIPFDILLINSRPVSGQWSRYSDYEFGCLVKRLLDAGKTVVATEKITQFSPQIPYTCDFGLTVTQIGWLSLHCSIIIMVASGPSWPTFNVWNLDSIKLRIILSNVEKANLAPNTAHCQTIDEAKALYESII